MISFHTLGALALFCLSVSLPHALHRVSVPAAGDTATAVGLPAVERLDVVIPPPSRSVRDPDPDVLGQPTPALREVDVHVPRTSARPARIPLHAHRPAPATREVG